MHGIESLCLLLLTTEVSFYLVMSSYGNKLWNHFQPPITVEFILDSEAKDQVEDCGLHWKPWGKHISVHEELDETLIESLSNDELVEFIGVDSEFLVYLNIKEFSHR
jgi:hypothetical protein